MEDLISRAAAIEAIKPLLYSGNSVSTLINLPAVDAVPAKHGRWIEDRTDVVCSCCGAAYDFEVLLLYRGEYNVSIYTGFEHCPHCGAKMDGDA